MMSCIKHEINSVYLCTIKDHTNQLQNYSTGCQESFSSSRMAAVVVKIIGAQQVFKAKSTTCFLCIGIYSTLELTTTDIWQAETCSPSDAGMLIPSASTIGAIRRHLS
jgi:hypothetical protein